MSYLINQIRGRDYILGLRLPTQAISRTASVRLVLERISLTLLLLLQSCVSVQFFLADYLLLW